MEKEKLVPELRFSEFEGEWNSEKLKNITKINPSNEILPSEFYYIDLESVNNGILGKVDIVEKEKAPSRAKRLVYKGDILYQTVRPYQKNNLYFYNDNKIPFVASTGYALLRCSKSDSRFIYQLIHSNVFVNKVMSKSTGTSYPAINTRDLSSIKIKLPTIKEQEKIGNFFSKMDKRIELQEELIENLEKQKKGFMQKIFNQEIRFKDENGEDYPEWEEKRLGDLIIEKNKKFTGKKYPLLSSTLNGIYLQTDYFEKSVASADLKDYKKILKDEFTYRSMSDTGEFKFNIQNIVKTGLVSPAYPVFDFRDKYVNNKYMYLELNYDDFFKRQLKKILQGGTRLSLPISRFKSLSIRLPVLEEQNKIANFLSLVDKRIDLEREQLKNYKEYKKGLMQRMFI